MCANFTKFYDFERFIANKKMIDRLKDYYKLDVIHAERKYLEFV